MYFATASKWVRLPQHIKSQKSQGPEAVLLESILFTCSFNASLTQFIRIQCSSSVQQVVTPPLPLLSTALSDMISMHWEQIVTTTACRANIEETVTSTAHRRNSDQHCIQR